MTQTSRRDQEVEKIVGAITAYYDSLSEREREELTLWAEFSERQLSFDSMHSKK